MASENSSKDEFETLHGSIISVISNSNTAKHCVII